MGAGSVGSGRRSAHCPVGGAGNARQHAAGRDRRPGKAGRDTDPCGKAGGAQRAAGPAESEPKKMPLLGAAGSVSDRRCPAGRAVRRA